MTGGFQNSFFPNETPVYSRAAVISFATACVTLFGILAAPIFFPAVYLYLLFPVSIVAGHIGFRKTSAEPGKFKGRTAALFGLYVGYFDLLLTLIALYVLVG